MGWGLADIVQNPAALPAAPAPAAAPPTSYPIVAPHTAPGSDPNNPITTNLSDEDYARFHAGLAPNKPASAPSGADDKPASRGWGLSDIVQNPDALKAAQPVAAPAVAPSTPPVGKTGILANMGAGSSDAVAGALGAPVDLMTGALNLIPRGINAATGSNIPTIQRPVGGSDWWKSAEGVIGADPRNVVPADASEQSARAAGAGMASMVLPWGAARSLPAVAGIPGAIQEALGSGSAAKAAAVGLGAGTGGQAAENAVPEPYKPLANMAGQLVGGGLVAIPTAAAQGVASAGADIARNFVKPMTAAGREELAGRKIFNAASDPGAVRDALNEDAPLLVPDSYPTTFQATGDQGLGNLERAVAKENSDRFIKRSNDQNKARADALGALQPNGDPEAPGRWFRQQLADIDARGDQAVARAQSRAQGATDALGNAPPVGADAQESALQSFGGRLQQGLDQPNQAAKAAVSKLYAAVDPDGTLAVDMKPFRSAVADIVKDRPQNLGPLPGEAGAVFSVSQLQPAVQKFSEVGALRQRIGDAMATERRANGQSQTYRYLTMLRSALDDTLAGAANSVGADRGASAIIAGHDATNPALAISNRSASDGAGSQVSFGHYGPSGAAAVSERAGNAMPGGSVGGLAGGNRGVAAGTADALIPQTARNLKPQSLHDWLISKGGVQDEGGEFRSQDLDKVHHRAGGRLVNPRGMEQDYAREAAIEEGFLPQHATINDFKDAVTSRQPVYRPEDTAAANARSQERTQAWQEDEARYNARDNVNVAAEQAGVRLSPAEREHATDLHMQGTHPDDAIQQAAASTEARAFDRNAQYNNFGSPGVPLAARQADLAIPETGLKPNFDEAALQRRRTADAAHAERMQTFGPKVPGVGPVLQVGDRPGEFKMPASSVPANLFSPGAAGAERIQAVQRAAVGNPQVMRDLQDYAAFSFRRAAENADGTVDPTKAERWLKAHSEVMGSFPGMRDRFGNAVAARQAMDEAAARKVAQVKDYQTAAVSRMMGDADPVSTVGRILKSDTALPTMRELASKTAGDPEARAGLRRAVVEHVLDNLRSNALAGNERLLKNDAFQTFARKTPQALRTVFSADEVQNIKNVAADYARSQKSVSGTKLPGGSNTAQDLAAGEHHGSHGPSMLNSVLAMEAGGELVGHLSGGMGKLIGMAGTVIGNALRSSGLEKLDNLVTEAMLNPALAKTLLAKVPQSQSSARGMAKIIAGQIQALGINSAIGSERSRND